MDYWTECIEIAFEESGIVATREQVEIVAGAVEGFHENYGMAFYSPPPGEYLSQENSRLKRELDKEASKRVCDECKGKGRLISHGPIHSCNSECYVCRGKGFVS